MQVPFGNGSWAQPQRFTWVMYYPWPPFQATYTNEPGLLIHLSPQDTGSIQGAISAGAAAAGNVVPGIGLALSAFAGVVGNVLTHLVSNPDGSMDIRMSAHGFDVGNAPAADPNVWLLGAWAPVAAALNQLGYVTVPKSGSEFPVPHPNLTSKGSLLKAEDLPVSQP